MYEQMNDTEEDQLEQQPDQLQIKQMQQQMMVRANNTGEEYVPVGKLDDQHPYMDDIADRHNNIQDAEK